ncbi:MAG: hypothetical protein STSR0007_02990 [Thermovirga sp.]
MKETEKLVQIFIRDGYLAGNDLIKGETMILKNVTDSCPTAYIVAASYLRQSEYEKGKEIMKRVCDECYDAVVNFWGEPEKLRTLAASELALHAGGQGDYEAIEWIEDRVKADAASDRVAVRDAQGILQGKTKLRDVVKFHKARAFAKAKMPEKAKEVLKDLSFASGKVFVDGEVQGLDDAIKKLQEQIVTVASAIWHFFFAA